VAQDFRIESVADGLYKIINIGNGKALEVDASAITEDGAKVQQWDYYGGDNQLWRLEQTESKYYKIINNASGKALDVSGISYESGAVIHQWNYVGGDNQQWQLNSIRPNPTLSPPF
jgi:Ricin-type beta-trefoil lectin domain-like